MELGEIGIASLHGNDRQLDRQKTWITLERDRPNQNTMQPKEACVAENLDHVASEIFWLRQSRVSGQGRNNLSTCLQVVLDFVERLNAFGDRLIRDRTDIFTMGNTIRSRLEIPEFLVLGCLFYEVAIR